MPPTRPAIPPSATRCALDDLEGLQGRLLGPTAWSDVTQDLVETFCAATGEDQWIHRDPPLAETGPFAGVIAPSALVIAMVPALLADLVHVTDAALSLPVAIHDITFPATIPVGTALRAFAEVVRVSDAPGGRELTARITVERDGGLDPVCLASVSVRYYV